MPIRSRPIRPDLLSNSEEDLRKSSRLVDLKKFNYSSIFIDNGLDLQNFSFFGDGKNNLDYVNESENLYYGRVDASKDPITPKRTSLSTVGTNTGTKLAVNFVAQAFNDFRAKFTTEQNARVRSIIQDSNYAGLYPYKGYESADTLHADELETFFNNYLAPYLNKTTNAVKIKDFHSFMQVFLGDFFVDHMLTDAGLPLTRSGFVSSNKCSPMVSGMIIEISNENHNNDKAKFERWINSRAYRTIREGAANFGFLIDKHAPWRFVANLNSPRLLPYIQGKGLLQDPQKPSRLKNNGQPFDVLDVYKEFYEKVYARDIPILKQTLLNYYNNYATIKGYTSFAAVSGCRLGRDAYESPSLSVKRQERQLYTIDDLNRDYSDDFWLNQYLIIRTLEGGVRLNEERLLKQFQKISHINRYLGYERALTYVNEYANVLSLNAGSGRRGVEEVGAYAFAKTANPQVTGVAKSVEPPDDVGI